MPNISRKRRSILASVNNINNGYIDEADRAFIATSSLLGHSTAHYTPVPIEVRVEVERVDSVRLMAEVGLLSRRSERLGELIWGVAISCR